MAGKEKVLITGGQGFFGAHIAKMLFAEGGIPIIFDLKENDGVLKQVLTAEQFGSLERVYGDISDAAKVTETVMAVEPTSIIHLAGLQIPTCRANPKLGAAVNVIGTINVFEAAKALGEKRGGADKAPMVVYASSAAVLGPAADYEQIPVPDDVYHKPRTLYGVFKIANEGTARIYYQDHKIRSIGLRPLTCFGVGREVGLTSGPTKAIKAALLGKKYEITFSGTTGFSFITDIARIFLGCSRSTAEGSFAFNIRGEVSTVEAFHKALCEVVPEAAELVTISGNEIPIMGDVDESALVKILKEVPAPHALKEPFPMPFVDAIKETIADFKVLQEKGELPTHDL